MASKILNLSRGFTLIELVVAVSISLFITGLIIANYSSYNSIQTLKQTALTMKNDFRFLQSKAANGEKPAGACPTLTGWAMTFSADSYAYQANCDDELIEPAVVVQLPAGVIFSPIPSPATVTFNVLTRGTSLITPLSIVLTGSGKQYTIVVSPSGDISEVGLQ
jgi:prepilin-type N-terminal cleavage/methylation domain-containing protein